MREKTIKIDNIEVGLKTSAAIPVLYNREFIGEDFFINMAKLFDAYEKGNQEELYKLINMVQEMAYIFAKHYNETHNKPFNQNYIEWLTQFETFSVANVTDDIMSLWSEESTANSTPKKKAKKQTEK